jgi:hypothetical protein
MNAGHPIIGFDIADHHRADLLRQAAERRLIAEARHARPTTGALRRRAGNLLVRLGEHLQGARESGLAPELGEVAGALRLAR